MWNKKFGFATLALGSVLTLLGPAPASARDRDDYSWRDDRSYTNSLRNRQIERERERLQKLRAERLRLEQRRNRDRYYSNQSRYGYQVSNGYYDKFGRWHSSF
jgi:hypothetical protein